MPTQGTRMLAWARLCSSHGAAPLLPTHVLPAAWQNKNTRDCANEQMSTFRPRGWWRWRLFSSARSTLTRTRRRMINTEANASDIYTYGASAKMGSLASRRSRCTAMYSSAHTSCIPCMHMRTPRRRASERISTRQARAWHSLCGPVGRRGAHAR